MGVPSRDGEWAPWLFRGRPEVPAAVSQLLWNDANYAPVSLRKVPFSSNGAFPGQQLVYGLFHKHFTTPAGIRPCGLPRAGRRDSRTTLAGTPAPQGRLGASHGSLGELEMGGHFIALANTARHGASSSLFTRRRARRHSTSV